MRGVKESQTSPQVIGRQCVLLGPLAPTQHRVQLVAPATAAPCGQGRRRNKGLARSRLMMSPTRSRSPPADGRWGKIASMLRGDDLIDALNAGPRFRSTEAFGFYQGAG